MTHNYNYDLGMLGLLIKKPCNYIGVLGPRKKLERMLTELTENGIHINDDELTKLYGTTGLDIGAEAAEEIALSMLAEIKAVMENRTGSSLRDKRGPIHTQITTHKEEEAIN
jgi:xanthine/CO dehydrogenase XdhC/CoxF family maturation factor